jgi:hypothetical protein
MPTLNASLQRDPSPAVRVAVVDAVGKLKPLNQETGAILEQVVVSDPVEAVRKSAQAALWQYHLAGYRSTGMANGLAQTNEPPIAKPKTVSKPLVAAIPVVKKPESANPLTPPVQPFRPITTGIGRGAIYPQTVEPPLAKQPETPAKIETKPEGKVIPKPAEVKPEPAALPKSTTQVDPPLPTIPVPALPLTPIPNSVSAPTFPGGIPEVPSVPPATIPSIPPPK